MSLIEKLKYRIWFYIRYNNIESTLLEDIFSIYVIKIIKCSSLSVSFDISIYRPEFIRYGVMINSIKVESDSLDELLYKVKEIKRKIAEEEKKEYIIKNNI